MNAANEVASHALTHLPFPIQGL